LALIFSFFPSISLLLKPKSLYPKNGEIIPQGIKNHFFAAFADLAFLPSNSA
jgi:hypothetical protein